ncbi:MAG: phosphoribosylamine--glycine ligase [archaeon]
MKKILIAGFGGREHALGWKLGQNKEVSEIIYAPGNARTVEGKGRNTFIDGTKKENFRSLFDLAVYENVNVVVVGPELPLADGIVDYFHSHGFTRIIGPASNQALLEGDKFYSYDINNQIGIPQAYSIKCFSVEEIRKAISRFEQPVLKYRWLAGGKGVRVYDSQRGAFNDLESFVKAFGNEVLVAERLFGEEFSVFGIADGKDFLPFPMSFQDHKRLLDGDKGCNTGGMGAYGPAPVASSQVVHEVSEKIMKPVVEKTGFRGFLYAGMMVTSEGLKVIEYNVRLGDPETQPLMMLMENDLYEILNNSLEGKLKDSKVRFKPGASVCVVLASKNYPYDYKTGLVIDGLDEISEDENLKIFHAGTKIEVGKILTNGGRVLGVTSYSPQGILPTQRLVYEIIPKIKVAGGFHYRKDIANNALESK